RLSPQGRSQQEHLVTPIALQALPYSFRTVLRFGSQRFQERRAGERQSPKQIPQCKRRVRFQLFNIVHASDVRQLSLKMRNGAPRRIVRIEISKGSTQQVE